jgi:hypothetical protein
MPAPTTHSPDHHPAVGPRTPEGRAVSARNATTHGLFARDVVLPSLGEDPAAYDALLAQLCKELPPRNLLERHYLEQIAAASWRLRRLHRWQAQVYEDETLTEDARLDRLDKVLRHETCLTRQIDRAVRTLNRDLKWLFESRARAEALYHRDLTEHEIRETPELDIEVQRLVWRQLRPTPAPDLGAARLDTAPASEGARICQNEPPPLPIPPLLKPDWDALPPTGWPDPPTEPPPVVSQKCENEPPPPALVAAPDPPLARLRERGLGSEGVLTPAPPSDPAPNLPFRGDSAQQGREVSGDITQDHSPDCRPRSLTATGTPPF